MTDRIELSKICAWGSYGVSAEERARPQQLQIDLAIELDLQQSSSSDSLTDTVDYSALHKKVVETVEANSFKLLETLGAKIMTVLFQDKRILSGEIRVSKPERLDSCTPTVVLRRTNS